MLGVSRLGKKKGYRKKKKEKEVKRLEQLILLHSYTERKKTGPVIIAFKGRKNKTKLNRKYRHFEKTGETKQ